MLTKTSIDTSDLLLPLVGLLLNGIEVQAGDPFPCGWIRAVPGPSTRQYAGATPELLRQAQRLAGVLD
jgi:hypothetical protein